MIDSLLLSLKQCPENGHSVELLRVDEVPEDAWRTFVRPGNVDHLRGCYDHIHGHVVGAEQTRREIVEHLNNIGQSILQKS